MPRNPIQDIVPGGRTIRNIPLPERRTERPAYTASSTIPTPTPVIPEHANKEALRSARYEFENQRGQSYEDVVKKGRKGPGKFALSLLAVILLIGAALFVSNVFHRGTLTVTPRTETVVLNNEIANTSFESVSFEHVGSRQVKATGEKQVTTQASGIIIIYNNHSASTQRLVKNTRFETPEGLIYRISDSVTVPGKSGSTPGSVEATVYADEAGDKYNVGLKDFTIPGFKGDPRYTTFYARSKTPLEGGFSGTVKIVAEADLVKAQTDIKAEASQVLLTQAKNQASSTSVLFDGAHSIKCAALPQETVSENQALIKMRCTLTAALLNREAFSSHLASLHVSGYANEPIYIRDMETLRFTPGVNFDPASKSISFTISGEATFEWIYNEDNLKSDLAGVGKSEVSFILKEFPMIEKADISVRPVWRRVFPDNVSRITIKKAE